MTASFTTHHAQRCLAILGGSDGPIVAADLAGKLGLSGTRETQRRIVRAIVKHLRETGAWIVATLQGGYCLTDDPDLWRDYQEGRKIDAKRILGDSHRRQKMIAGGQGLLFGIRPGGYR